MNEEKSTQEVLAQNKPEKITEEEQLSESENDVSEPESEETSAQQVPSQKNLFKKVKNHMVYIIVFLILIPFINVSVSVYSCIKSVSSLELSLLEGPVQRLNSSDFYRIGADNRSDDYKYLTKGVVTVTQIRNDDEPHIGLYTKNNDNKGMTLKIYNAGWCDLNDVTIEVDPEMESTQNLLHPEKFSLTLDTMRYGQYYELGELTAADIKDKENLNKIEFLCKVDGGTECYTVWCNYIYNSSSDSISTSGKGDYTDIFDFSYCIERDKGIGKYEFPIEYSCPAHKYEEIKLSITADKSCYVSYYIELYSKDTPKLTTEERGTYLYIPSINPYS